MRAGICIVQQALTAEAASMVKQSISLARRRGHAQVTPLHVASAMLGSPTGLLRRACLQCHSHPLQCKALELCFNVALNRLPASTPSSILVSSGSHHYSNNPCFSNALVAAFKRAQAHQRRGSVENQQQPILALKIELEQLIVSILDDPSVSRVMREAGFSSPQVKGRVEEAVSLSLDIISSTQISPSSQMSKDSSAKQPLELIGSHLPVSSQPSLGERKPFDQTRHEDVLSVLKEMLSKKIRNTVVVGECLATAEGVARGVMDKFERGNMTNALHDHGDLRYVKFISVPLYSLRNISKKDELEEKLVELRGLIKSYIGRGNVVLYLGDLMWVSEFWSNYGEQKRNYYSHNLEQIIMELKRLVCRIGEDGRLSLMGIATFQTYMRCKTGQPSLEKLWDLHPVAVPVGSLSLSLNFDSYLQTDMSTMEPKDRSDLGITTASTISSLPLWLQKCREENRNSISINDKECIEVNNGYNKWNPLGSPAPQKHPHYPEKLIFNSSSKILSSSKPLSSHDSTLKESPKEYQFWVFEDNDDDGYEERIESKPDLLSNPNSSPNSASSSEVMEDDRDDTLARFKEFNAENFKLLCEEIEEKVPWQKEIIPEIATTILQCRSGMNQRKGNLKHKEDREESWLFFLGSDSKGKEQIARELAKLVFGSQNSFVSIGLSSFSSPRADSTEEYSKNKRPREESGCSYLHRFGEALNENPHRVFFMEDFEQVDRCSQKGIKHAIQRGRVTLADGETHVPLKDAIVIFSCESFSSVSRACSPSRSQKYDEVTNEKEDVHNLEEKSTCGSLDLNISIEDDNGDELSYADNGILESVDRQVFFKTQGS